MSSAKRISRLWAGLSVAEYTFAEKGDVLAVHAHESEAENHLTIVVRGSVRVLGDDVFFGEIIGPGECRDWPVGIEHGFEALEPDTRILNIRKAGL